MLRLTTEQVQFFKDQGYLTLEALAEPEEVSEMRAIFEKLFQAKAGENEGAYGEMIRTSHEEHEHNSPQLLNPVNYAPQLHKMKCFENAQDFVLLVAAHFIVRPNIGSDEQFVNSTLAVDFAADLFEEIKNKTDFVDCGNFGVGCLHYYDAFAVWVDVEIPSGTSCRKLTG